MKKSDSASYNHLPNEIKVMIFLYLLGVDKYHLGKTSKNNYALFQATGLRYFESNLLTKLEENNLEDNKALNALMNNYPLPNSHPSLTKKWHHVFASLVHSILPKEKAALLVKGETIHPNIKNLYQALNQYRDNPFNAGWQFNWLVKNFEAISIEIKALIVVQTVVYEATIQYVQAFQSNLLQLTFEKIIALTGEKDTQKIAAIQAKLSTYSNDKLDELQQRIGNAILAKPKEVLTNQEFVFTTRHSVHQSNILLAKVAKQQAEDMKVKQEYNQMMQEYQRTKNDPKLISILQKYNNKKAQAENVLPENSFVETTLSNSQEKQAEKLELDINIIIPQELISWTLTYLSAKDLYQVALVNRLWNRLQQDDAIWSQLSIREGYGNPEDNVLNLPKEAKSYYQAITKNVNVCFKLLSLGRSYSLNIRHQAPLSEIKSKIVEQLGYQLHPTFPHLIFHGKQLDNNDASLASYDVQESSVVHML